VFQRHQRWRQRFWRHREAWRTTSGSQTSTHPDKPPRQPSSRAWGRMRLHLGSGDRIVYAMTVGSARYLDDGPADGGNARQLTYSGDTTEAARIVAGWTICGDPLPAANPAIAVGVGRGGISGDAGAMPASGPAVSPDGAWVFFSRPSGVYWSLWKLPAQGAGSHQSGRQANERPRSRPMARLLAYLYPAGGSQRTRALGSCSWRSSHPQAGAPV